MQKEYGSMAEVREAIQHLFTDAGLSIHAMGFGQDRAPEKDRIQHYLKAKQAIRELDEIVRFALFTDDELKAWNETHKKRAGSDGGTTELGRQNTSEAESGVAASDIIPLNGIQGNRGEKWAL